MKRLHAPLSVDALERNLVFYSPLFGCEPAARKHDDAKRRLDDPRVNFAISNRGARPGVDPLGFQVDDDASLEALHADCVDADASAAVAMSMTRFTSISTFRP